MIAIERISTRVIAAFGLYVSCLCVICPAAIHAHAQSDAGNTGPTKTESGVFLLHKFAKQIGRESYTVEQAGDQVTLNSDFLFTDRMTPVPLKTTFTADRELRPVAFRSQGKAARPSTLNDEVTVSGDRVTIRRGETITTAAAPKRFFVVDGYAPAAMQEMLLRFWLGHGRPALLPVFPAGTIHIQPEGKLEVSIAGKPVKLAGYTVAGLVWGEESLWLDEEDHLAAVVTTDAELDHFEAVREPYEEALPTFISKAAAADLKVLSELTSKAKAAPAKQLAIVGATLIDGNGGPPVPNAVVITEGDTITATGPATQIPVPEGATILHAEGKTILPGLWDMHAHYEQVEWGPIYLASGITTVRDCGNEFDYITTVRDSIRSGTGIGPQILIAGIVDGPGPAGFGIVTAETPEQARAVVDRYQAAGALQIKIYSSLKPELVPVIATEAHRLGMTVTGHVPFGMTATQGVEAGMDQINHAQYLAAEFIKPGSSPMVFDFDSPEAKKKLAFFKSHNTVVDPTLAIYEWQYHPASVPVSSFEPGVLKAAPQLAEGLTNTGVHEPDVARAQFYYDGFVATTRALHQAGIRIVAGTDQTVPGYSLHRELELHVKAGFTPMEAIQSATIVPARVMGLDKTMGSVEAGKRADLVIIDGDPLIDISNTRKVFKTISGGAVYDPAPLWESVDFAP